MKIRIQNLFTTLALLSIVYAQGTTAFAQSVQPIVSFENTNGANPEGGLTLGPDGNFYGTTVAGGANGYGTVFRVTTNGELTTLVNFVFTNGAYPVAPLTLGPDGNFYGTTEGGYGGDFFSFDGDGWGTVFKMTTNGALTTLYSFNDNTNGADPQTALTVGPDGSLYGTTSEEGDVSGTIFKITTNGMFSTLISFAPGTGDSLSALVPGADGDFYDTTSYDGGSYGIVFKVTTDGVLTTLYSFTGGDDGLGGGPLTLGPDGNFYSMDFFGGSTGDGTIFRVTTNGMFSTVYTFTGNDGAGPLAALTLGPDGNFYGTVVQGGFFYDSGTVFEFTTNGMLTTLYSFTGFNDGGNPMTSLTLGPDGNFYGTTSEGGTDGNGVIFRLNLSPEIVRQPVPQDTYPGGQAAFSIALFGTAPYSYQWLSNNIPIANSTNSTLNISNATISDDVRYAVIVTNAWGSITSSAAKFVVGLQPFITNGPASEMLPIGDMANFKVSVTGDLPLHYQWYFNTNNFLSGATNCNFSIGPALTNDDGYYQVVVTNFFGSATSDVASLIVTVEPNMVGIANDPFGGSTTLSLASYPGSTNYLYATTNLLLPVSHWQLVATNVAGPDGLFQFTDTNTLGVPAKFYMLSDQWIVPAISIGAQGVTH